MLEIKVTVEAQDLASAINNLAVALGKRETAEAESPKRKKTANPTPAPVPQPTAAPAAMPATAEPVNPIPAPQTAPGAPLSATPAQTAIPIVPTVPVAAPAPAATPVANVVPQIPVPPAPQPYAAPVTQQPYVAPVAPAVPTSAPQYTLDMIATAGSRLIDAGKMDQLMGVLARFGVVSLTDLAPENYGAVACELRALGAAI